MFNPFFTERLVLVLMNLDSAFDMVMHSVTLKNLKCCVGFSSTLLLLFKLDSLLSLYYVNTPEIK